jgi:hypothetical protein
VPLTGGATNLQLPVLCYWDSKFCFCSPIDLLRDLHRRLLLLHQKSFITSFPPFLFPVHDASGDARAALVLFSMARTVALALGLSLGLGLPILILALLVLCFLRNRLSAVHDKHEKGFEPAFEGQQYLGQPLPAGSHRELQSPSTPHQYVSPQALERGAAAAGGAAAEERKSEEWQPVTAAVTLGEEEWKQLTEGANSLREGERKAYGYNVDSARNSHSSRFSFSNWV